MLDRHRKLGTSLYNSSLIMDVSSWPWLPFLGAIAKSMPVCIVPSNVMWRSYSLLSYPSLIAQWLEHLHGKQKVLVSIPGLGKHFLPEYGCSLHSELPLKSLWMIGKELTYKHACLVRMSWSMHQWLALPWRSPALVGKLLCPKLPTKEALELCTNLNLPPF